jgi:hypothetical protein
MLAECYGFGRKKTYARKRASDFLAARVRFVAVYVSETVVTGIRR